MLKQTRWQNRIYLHREKLPVLIGYKAVLSKQIVHLLGHCTRNNKSKADTRGRKKKTSTKQHAGRRGRGSHRRLPAALWSCLGQNLRPLQPETEPGASQGTPSCLVSRAEKKTTKHWKSVSQRGWRIITPKVRLCAAAIISWWCFFTQTKQGISRYRNCQCFSPQGCGGANYDNTHAR